MFNLLPQSERQIITREYRLRLAATCLLFFSLLCLVAIISLVPSLFLSSQIEKVVKDKFDLLNGELVTISKDNPQDVLAASAKKSDALLMSEDNKKTYEIFDEVIGNRTSGIKLVGINVRTSKTGVREITILGQAEDRESLLSYAKKLDETKSFSNVTVPVSNFAPAADIKFSILAKLNEKATKEEIVEVSPNVKVEEE